MTTSLKIRQQGGIWATWISMFWSLLAVSAVLLWSGSGAVMVTTGGAGHCQCHHHCQGGITSSQLCLSILLEHIKWKESHYILLTLCLIISDQSIRRRGWEEPGARGNVAWEYCDIYWHSSPGPRSLMSVVIRQWSVNHRPEIPSDVWIIAG